MKALFPYIGESVVRAVIAADPQAVVSAFNENRDCEIEVLLQVQLAFPKAGISFDGFQKLDIGLLINRSELIPIEVKLGRTGLHRANIDKLLEPKP